MREFSPKFQNPTCKETKSEPIHHPLLQTCIEDWLMRRTGKTQQFFMEPFMLMVIIFLSRKIPPKCNTIMLSFCVLFASTWEFLQENAQSTEGRKLSCSTMYSEHLVGCLENNACLWSRYWMNEYMSELSHILKQQQKQNEATRLSPMMCPLLSYS